MRPYAEGSVSRVAAVARVGELLEGAIEIVLVADAVALDEGGEVEDVPGGDVLLEVRGGDEPHVLGGARDDGGGHLLPVLPPGDDVDAHDDVGVFLHELRDELAGGFELGGVAPAGVGYDGLAVVGALGRAAGKKGDERGEYQDRPLPHTVLRRMRGFACMMIPAAGMRRSRPRMQAATGPTVAEPAYPVRPRGAERLRTGTRVGQRTDYVHQSRRFLVRGGATEKAAVRLECVRAGRILVCRRRGVGANRQVCP